MKLPSVAIDLVLDRWPVARLATAGTTRPHIIPIVFARQGEVLWSPIDGKPKRGGQLTRVKNLLAQSGSALLIDGWDSDWSRLWWLRVDVVASVVTPAVPIRDAEARAAVAALEAKYSQYQEIPVLGDPPTLLRFAVERVQSWCASSAAVASIESVAHTS